MKKTGMLLVVFILISLVCAVPQYTDRYMNDFAGIFSETEIGELRSLLTGMEQETSAEAVVVSSESCEGSPNAYAQEIFDSWKIGKAEKDNGLLILYCKEEKKIWVQTGYGLEGILPDSKIGRMLDDYYVPARDAGNITYGIILFTEEISDVLIENKEEIIAREEKSSSSSWIFVSIFIAIILMIFGVFLALKSRKVKKEKVQEKTGARKKYIGIKEDAGFGFLNLLVSISVFAAVGLFVHPFLGLIASILVSYTLNLWRGVRCERDGLKMKKTGKKGEYTEYKCSKGHIGKMLVAAGAGYAAGYFAGGHGGGFGGGGFGGGASGGGGAGR
ncbi:MAG: TPM domain-containing protein [Nanoarchaeota archaeon]